MPSCRDVARPVPACRDVARPVPACRDVAWPVPACCDVAWPVPACCDVAWPVPACCDVARPVPAFDELSARRGLRRLAASRSAPATTGPPRSVLRPCPYSGQPARSWPDRRTTRPGEVRPPNSSLWRNGGLGSGRGVRWWRGRAASLAALWVVWAGVRGCQHPGPAADVLQAQLSSAGVRGSTTVGRARARRVRARHHA
jgi:hypothetical protein